MSVEDEERKTRERNVENTRAFMDWAISNTCAIQVSCGRSGLGWLNRSAGRITGKETPAIWAHDSREYSSDNLWFNSHGNFIIDYVSRESDLDLSHLKFVLLVRDPRDAALSDCYRKVLIDEDSVTDTGGVELGMSSARLEAFIKRVCRHWVPLLEFYTPLQTLVVQYEQLCLYPQKNWTDILNFLGVDPILLPQEDVAAWNRLSRVEFLGKYGSGTKSLRKHWIRQPGRECMDFYVQHCLKWLHNPFFWETYNREIWQVCGEWMQRFGYTEYGHSIEKWRRQYD